MSEVYRKQIFDSNSLADGIHYLIPSEWAKKWKNFFVNCTDLNPPGKINNFVFLSRHIQRETMKALDGLDNDEEDDNDCFVLKEDDNLAFDPLSSDDKMLFYRVSKEDWEALVDM